MVRQLWESDEGDGVAERKRTMRNSRGGGKKHTHTLSHLQLPPSGWRCVICCIHFLSLVFVCAAVEAVAKTAEKNLHQLIQPILEECHFGNWLAEVQSRAASAS